LDTGFLVKIQGQYCTIAVKSGKDCYQEEGKYLVHEKNGKIWSLLENGTIKWSHGYTTSPVDANFCKKPEN